MLPMMRIIQFLVALLVSASSYSLALFYAPEKAHLVPAGDLFFFFVLLGVFVTAGIFFIHFPCWLLAVLRRWPLAIHIYLHAICTFAIAFFFGFALAASQELSEWNLVLRLFTTLMAGASPYLMVHLIFDAARHRRAASVS